MVPKWLSKLLGGSVPPTEMDNVRQELAEKKLEAEYANQKGAADLAEVRRIRTESREVHKRVRKTLQENHFADLMMRALEPR